MGRQARRMTKLVANWNIKGSVYKTTLRSERSAFRRELHLLQRIEHKKVHAFKAAKRAAQKAHNAKMALARAEISRVHVVLRREERRAKAAYKSIKASNRQ